MSSPVAKRINSPSKKKRKGKKKNNEYIPSLRTQIKREKEKQLFEEVEKEKEEKSQSFLAEKYQKEAETLKSENSELKSKNEKLIDKLREILSDQKDQVHEMGQLKNGLKMFQSQLVKKEKKIEKLYQTIQGMNLKNSNLVEDAKKLKFEVEKQRREELLAVSPQKKKIVEQKREIKNLGELIERIKTREKEKENSLRNLQKSLGTKQDQIKSLMNKVNGQTTFAFKKIDSVRKENEGLVKEIEDLKLTLNQMKKERKRKEKEQHLKDFKIKLEMEKQERKLNRWREVFQTLYNYNHKEEEKILLLTSPMKLQEKLKAVERSDEKERESQKMIQELTTKMQEVIDENEELKIQIEGKEKEMNDALTKAKNETDKTMRFRKHIEERIKGIKEDLEEKTERCEKLAKENSKMRNLIQNSKKKEKEIEYKQQKQFVDTMMAKYKKMFN